MCLKDLPPANLYNFDLWSFVCLYLYLGLHKTDHCPCNLAEQEKKFAEHLSSFSSLAELGKNCLLPIFHIQKVVSPIHFFVSKFSLKLSHIPGFASLFVFYVLFRI